MLGGYQTILMFSANQLLIAKGCLKAIVSDRPAASSSADPPLERDPRDGGSMPSVWFRYINIYPNILCNTEY